MSNDTHYEVLARKYRPQTFSELTGQEHVSRTLQNAIDSGRVAHAFLFSGARGVGKTSTARILAKTLNCERGLTHEPCNVCPICIEITKGSSTDVFEIDGASNTGVDDIRELRDNVKYLPSHSRFKIFIIDEVHMLSNNAFNALLKTLEEPPDHVKFIFATTEPHKLPVTILSRCQRFDFKRVPLAKIIGRLRQIAEAEGITISDASLALIARKGDGSMRDALTAFDQVLACCGNSVDEDDVVALIGAVDRRLLMDISAAVFAKDTQSVLAGVKRVDGVGYNMRQFCQELIEHFRNLMIVQTVQKPEEILDLSDQELSDLRSQSAGFTSVDLQRRLTLLIKADGDMAFASCPRLIIEIALLKAATLEPVLPIVELMEKVRLLETQSVHTPGLPWEAGRDHGHVAPVKHSPSPAASAKVEPPVKAVAVERPSVEKTPFSPSGGPFSWERFVAFVNDNNRLFGSQLEHGSPLRKTDNLLEIGFPEGSHYLVLLQDAESIAEIKGLLKRYEGKESDVAIKPIVPEKGCIPQTVAEKKRTDLEQQQQELRHEVENHPVISEALRVFGGTITEIRKEGTTL